MTEKSEGKVYPYLEVTKPHPRIMSLIEKVYGPNFWPVGLVVLSPGESFSALCQEQAKDLVDGFYDMGKVTRQQQIRLYQEIEQSELRNYPPPHETDEIRRQLDSL